MTTVQIGVEDQTVSVRRNAAGKVAEFAFARSVPIEPGMVIAFDGSEQEHFEVTNVRGERIVAVRPRNWSVVEDQVTSGLVREVTVSPSEAGGGGGHESDGDMESRSSDGSDTEGSLVDFIASDPDSDEEEFGPDEEQDVEEKPSHRSKKSKNFRTNFHLIVSCWKRPIRRGLEEVGGPGNKSLGTSTMTTPKSCSLTCRKTKRERRRTRGMRKTMRKKNLTMTTMYTRTMRTMRTKTLVGPRRKKRTAMNKGSDVISGPVRVSNSKKNRRTSLSRFDL